MLLSMTGQGQGRRQYGSAEVNVEVRAVNNRHLKLHVRTSDGLSGLESQIEANVRRKLRRGALQLSVELAGSGSLSPFQLNTHAVAAYSDQCRRIGEELGLDGQVRLVDLLPLPGVVPESSRWGGAGVSKSIDDELRELVLAAVDDAVDCLNRMRAVEGRSMRDELAQQVEKMRQRIAAIDRRAPAVIDDYRQRLKSRLAVALKEVGGEVQESDVVREVLLMADKSDVREELVRLRSHCDQFTSLLDDEQSQGRKLDFLIQEMFRETNTIGAKAGDAEIAQAVVDLKTIIEQMRELVQNVE